MHNELPFLHHYFLGILEAKRCGILHFIDQVLAWYGFVRFFEEKDEI